MLLADTLVGLVVAAAAAAKLLLKNDENGKDDNSGREKSQIFSERSLNFHEIGNRLDPGADLKAVKVAAAEEEVAERLSQPEGLAGQYLDGHSHEHCLTPLPTRA